MRRKFQWMILVACGVLLGGAICQAETNPLPGVAAPQHSASTQHRHLSPIEYFRGLLAMTPEERERELANRPPADRAAILAKVKEYEPMSRAMREARLCQTELHWALSRLMRLAPSERANQLAEVSPLYVPMVMALLREWDELPAEKQKALVEREDFIGLYMRVQSSPAATQREILDKLSPERRASWELEMARWQALPEEQRAELCGQFQRFCMMSGTDQQETVSALSETERKQMEQALRMFALLPPEQRMLCINSFRKFATMAPAERNEFLRNAARWDAMTPHERELWREMVQRLPPMPPMPPGFSANVMPPMPPVFPQRLPPMPPLPPNVTTPVIVARAPAPPQPK